MLEAKVRVHTLLQGFRVLAVSLAAAAAPPATAPSPVV